MYSYLLIPVVLIAVVLFKYKKPLPPSAPATLKKTKFNVQYYIKKVEPYSDFNPELFKEFINNLELFDTTKVVDYLNNAVKNIRDFSLYTNSEDFEEVFIDDITKELLKQNDI